MALVPHPVSQDHHRACTAEWYFRSSLDRYVWIHGMLFAYLHPSFEAALHRIDKMSLRARLFIRTLITAGQSTCLSVLPLSILQLKLQLKL